MKLRSRVPLGGMILLIAILTGCGGGGEAPQQHGTVLEVRPLALKDNGRWIGNAICYGPHRDGQRPGGPSPTALEIAEDLQLMAGHWKLLRVYGSSEFTEVLLTVIRDGGFDMKVMLGAWIAPAPAPDAGGGEEDDDAANGREIAAAIRLANAFPDIVLAVSVGNETQIHWSSHRSSMETLVEYVREVRAKVAVPVTVADDYNFWNKPESRVMANAVDFVTMHAHPMWNGIQLEDALPWLRDQLASVRALHPDRSVVLGETGWATTVHDEGEQAELIKGTPGELEQKAFHDAFHSWATAERQAVFFFEAFDENWKGGSHPNEVEKHWGLFRADRTAKAAMASER